MTRGTAAVLLVTGAAAALPAQSTALPRWATFEGVRLGAPLDEILALDASCEPADSPHENAIATARWAFGYLMPELLMPDVDTTRVRAALETATVCHVGLHGGDWPMFVLAVDRRVVAMHVYFKDADAHPWPADSIRSALRARWPRATDSRPLLDSWLGRRYVSYLLVSDIGTTTPFLAGELIIADLAACTAFERRLVSRRPGVFVQPC